MNSRPLAPKASALANCATPRNYHRITMPNIPGTITGDVQTSLDLFQKVCLPVKPFSITRLVMEIKNNYWLDSQIVCAAD